MQGERQVVKLSRWFRAQLLGGFGVIDEDRQWWHLADATPPPARTAEQAMLAELPRACLSLPELHPAL